MKNPINDQTSSLIDSRLRFYRYVQKSCVQKWVIPHFFSKSRMLSTVGANLNVAAEVPQCLPLGESRRAWFHASSVGELESLWTLILAWVDQSREVIVTVFSESASDHIGRLKENLSKRSAKVVFIGYSPWEGSWSSTLDVLRPDVFITAKYEAWPDLWLSLAERQIPLVTVGAQLRRSLKMAKWFCKNLGGRLPKQLFLCSDVQSKKELSQEFPDAEIQVAGEARWDRVYSRFKEGNPRAKELVQRFKSLGRPWGIMGQVWAEDLRIWKDKLRNLPGTLWVVPHQVVEENVQALEKILKKEGLYPIRSAQMDLETSESHSKLCLVVNETGFLSELYSAADWAYVGGGFGLGVHSTIEPAIHGIPISAGSRRTEYFPEIAELVDSGQLSILHDVKDLDFWLDDAVYEISAVEGSMVKGISPRLEKRNRWIGEARARLGNTGKILRAIEQAFDLK